MKKEVTYLSGTGFRDLVQYPIYKRKRVSGFIIDETAIQIGNQHFWLWICIESIDKFCAWNLHFRGEKYACC